MMKIEWLDTAREDLFSIYGWYAKESLEAATNLFRKIVESVDALCGNPRMGHREMLLEDFEYEFRTMLTVSRNYRIIYFLDEDTIFIFRIWDCRQNPRTLKERQVKRK